LLTEPVRVLDGVAPRNRRHRDSASPPIFFIVRYPPARSLAKGIEFVTGNFELSDQNVVRQWDPTVADCRCSGFDQYEVIWNGHFSASDSPSDD
jgi:hypothetical protein